MKTNHANYPGLFVILFLFFISMQSFAQKSKDIEPVLYCVKDLGNGIYQATFSYYNPSNKEVVIDESASTIKYNNGKKVAKGLNIFKPGSVNKVFTKEFGPNDYVEWTIISNGNVHTVYANANSAKCSANDGFIFPVIGNNGKSYNLIGQELSSLCDNVAGETPSELIFQIAAGKVLVEIVPKEGQMQNVLNLLQGAPFNIAVSDFLLNISEYTNLAAIDVYFKPQDLCILNNYANIINFARPVYPAYNNSGGVSTQGDAAQTSNTVRESFRVIKSDGNIVPVDGSGIKVGVLSDSYDMALGVPGFAALDIANGELPEAVEVLKDNLYKSSDEGRAMMQIIHDVAPGAAMAFHTATASPRQFEVGFKALKEVGCDIIVDDITFITEPFFGIGRISEEIQSYVSQSGKFHYTSAGNIANKGYQATFNSSSSLPVTNFITAGSPTRAHVFGTNADGSQDYLQKISVVPGTYLLVLQWKEYAASQQNQVGASNDLDIYVVDNAGRLLVGNNRVNVNGDPTEIIVFKSTGTGDANILITNATGATNVPFRYIAFRTSAEGGTPDGLKFPEYFGNGVPTVSGHAMTPESVTVGAVDYRYATNPIAEAFSSYGGLLKDQTNLLVDLYAPDGGNTASTTIGQLATCETCDKDDKLNFYGTSAAAPHAAAAMALLRSALPYWYPDGSGSTIFTADQTLEKFKNTSVNFTARDGSNGQFINTLNAFKSLAAQTAKITSLTILSGNVGAEPISVSIIGEFFPAQNSEPYPAKVYFDGKELTNIQVVSDTEIIATIPEFTGNPEVTIYTQPKPGTEGNGGFSDPVKILPDGKYAINIVPNNAVFEYGQDISLSYFVQGLPPEEIDTSLTYAEIMASLGFPEVKLSSGADAKLAEGGYPIVFDYVVTPSFAEPLSQELFDKYQVNFISGYVDSNPEIGKIGYLTITKKDLTITPPEVVYSYGDPIDVSFNYAFDSTGISDEASFRSLIDQTHANDFKDGIPNKFQAIVNKFQAIVNDYDLSFLNGGSWSASERTIQNKFQAIVNGMNIVNLDNENFTNYISARQNFDDGTTSKFQAIVNKFQAIVNSEDLFKGDVELGIENKFQAIVNKFQAIVNGDDPERPFKDYADVFTIIDAEDAPPEDGSDNERVISEIYALNMLTGIDVTGSEEDRHYVYPGAFLNAMSANFNITYGVGRVVINPKDLSVSTNNIILPYGEAITEAQLLELTTFDGWAFEGEFQESVDVVFPDGVPFYFVKNDVEFELSELKELGDYEIKIRNPKNYLINSANDDTHGTLKIIPATLSFNPDPVIVKYGETPVIVPNFGSFAYPDVENQDVLNDSNGIIPYYFMKAGDVEKYTINGALKMGVGEYDIFIEDVDGDNYIIENDPNRGKLTISEALLTIKTGPLDLEYGDNISNTITTEISGFAYDESITSVFGNAIPYLFIDENNIAYNINDVKSIGVYAIQVMAPENYEIAYADDHGILTIDPKELHPETDYYETPYGSFNVNNLVTDFGGFAYDETAFDVYPNGVIYSFEKDGLYYEVGDKLSVGDYNILIEGTQNYVINSYGSNHSRLRIVPAELSVTISPTSVIVGQGEPVAFSFEFGAFAYNDENRTTVFENGIPYYFVDDYGVAYYDTTLPGAYYVQITDPKNYTIISNEAHLFINPADENAKKVRSYADCVSYNPNAIDGLIYTAVFRYENDNEYPVYVNDGPDNFLTGTQFKGQLPTVFMPGSGTFEIRFDGQQLVWSLTTYDGTHKSSISSATTSESGKCDAKLDGAYSIYPNPVKTILNIKQNVVENNVSVLVLNMYGFVVINAGTFAEPFSTKEINMSGLSTGIYIVRITSSTDVRTYNILKE
ncbi:S8/S53 family peptidase [Gaetbulibacter aquiaggeris]|uniref:S8/S53 family peptidase n=1 Tax=Gaetbulibacter aquiaggeris TaxID=1735373 RepID=A0ABW7MRE6_9FLAO